ncbi:MAG: hypothetical protein KF849_15340 [Rhizobiaceae bacterium]|nr:hypothetical protein [Rhizobiaceae bacterium]
MQGIKVNPFRDANDRSVFARMFEASRSEGRRLRQATAGTGKPIGAVRRGYPLKLCVDVVGGSVSIGGWRDDTLPGFVWDGSGFWCQVDDSICALALADLLERQPELVADAAESHVHDDAGAAARLEQALSTLVRWTLVDQSEFFADAEICGGESDFTLSQLADTTGPRDGRIWPTFTSCDAYEWLCRRRDAMWDLATEPADG